MRAQQLGALINEGRGHVSGVERGVREHCLQEGDVGGDPADAEFRQCAPGPGHGGGVVAPAAGELDQHRVKVGADLGTGVDGSAVEPDARTAG